MTDLITVRVDKKTREQIKKHRINVSETVRRALEKEIRKKEEEELAGHLEKAKKILSKIPDEEIIRAVRESRDER